MLDTHSLDVLVVGIDAASKPILDRLVEGGDVPHVAGLLGDGVVSSLESQIPPWTSSAWPSIYTGVNPGKHGAFGFVHFDDYDWEIVTADHVREHPVWVLLAEHGFTSVVVNVPITYPPDAIEGAIVPGFVAPEDPECHPPGVLDELRDAIGEYRVYPAHAGDGASLSDKEKMREYCRLARMRAEAFCYLTDEYDPEFGFVQFQKTDTVFHEFDGEWSKVRRIYRTIDEQIGRILRRYDPSCVLLVSDHGIEPYDAAEFRVNEFLRNHGYLETVVDNRGMPSWSPIRTPIHERTAPETRHSIVVDRVIDGMTTLGVSPDGAVSKLERVGLGDAVRRRAPETAVRSGSERVDFSNSMAYMRARTELGVRINLQGREPDGMVEAGEYEQIRTELIELLGRVETPDGRPVFEAVRPCEEFFYGPYVDEAVDVVTIPRGFRQSLSAEVSSDQFGSPSEPWNHTLQGVLVAAGEGIDERASLQHPHIFDVAPTVMAALGVPYSDRMDGQALPVVDDAGQQSYPSYVPVENTARAANDVEKRLVDLGYL